MTTRILFLLPDIVEKLTGGNVYNGQIMAASKMFAEVHAVVVSGCADVSPALLAEYDVVVVDSLLMSVIHPARDADCHGVCWIALVHYLPICDPRMEGHLEKDWRVQLAGYDGFVTTSRFTASCLARLGIKEARIGVVYPGLDTSFRKTGAHLDMDGRSKTGCKFLAVSSLLPGKGLLEFADLLDQLNQPGWTWTVVGDDALDPDYAEAFKDRIRDSAWMEWSGVVERGGMPGLYAKFDCFVLPSRFETLGMAIREAMACGLPAIAYDVGGVSESLENGGGYMIPAFDDALMISVLQKMILDRPDRLRLGQEAEALSSDFPGWSSAAKRFVSFVTEIQAGF